MEDSEKLRKFMKSLVKASKRKKEKLEARDELGRQVEKVKALAVKKGVKKASVTRALKELEKKIAEVIETEKKSIALHQEDSSQTRRIADELNSMEKRFSSFTTKDIQIISELKSKIEELEMQRQDRIDLAVEEIKSKLDEIESRKTDRSEKILELEEKIKQRVSDNFLELMKIEKQLGDMEFKYKKMKQSGKTDRKTLSAFKSKMSGLKQHLFVKKQKLIEEEMRKAAPLPELPKQIEFRKPEIEFKQPEFRREKSAPRIRHDLILEPIKAPEPPKPGLGEQETFEEILHEEHIPFVKLRRDIPRKKKGFFRRLFG